MTLTAFNIT